MVILQQKSEFSAWTRTDYRGDGAVLDVILPDLGLSLDECIYLAKAGTVTSLIFPNLKLIIIGEVQ